MNFRVLIIFTPLYIKFCVNELLEYNPRIYPYLNSSAVNLRYKFCCSNNFYTFVYASIEVKFKWKICEGINKKQYISWYIDLVKDSLNNSFPRSKIYTVLLSLLNFIQLYKKRQNTGGNRV